MLYPEENNTINALNSVEKRASNLVYVVCDVYRKLHYINIHFFITYDICISKHAFSVTILQNIMCKCAKKMGERLCPPDPVPGLCPWTPLGTSVPEPPDWPVYILGFSGGIPPPKKKSEIPQKFDETEEPEARIHGWMTLTKILVPIFLYCLNCTKFGQLILRKIIKIVANRCQILRLKCTQFAGGAYSTLQTPSWI